jgi:hypothetical protein
MDTTANLYWPILILSNVAALSMLYFSWRKPLVARLGIFALLFIAGIVNWMLTTDVSEIPADINFTFSLIDAGFVHRWFISHGDTAIRLIAICQWLVAFSLLMRLKVRRISAIAGIVLILVVVPIGFGSPFPFTFIIAMALFTISRESQIDLYNANETVHELNRSNDD